MFEIGSNLPLRGASKKLADALLDEASLAARLTS